MEVTFKKVYYTKTRNLNLRLYFDVADVICLCVWEFICPYILMDCLGPSIFLGNIIYLYFVYGFVNKFP